MRRIACGLLLMISACAHQPGKPEAASLVGTWRLVEYWDQRPDQPRQFPFGEHPLGYFVYDDSGHVSIHISRNPPLPRLSSDARQRLSAEQLLATLDAYVGYFGTYTVDASRHIVVHHVEGDVRREYTGTDQERPFELNGDELRIGDGKTWLRRLVRVTPKYE